MGTGTGTGGLANGSSDPKGAKVGSGSTYVPSFFRFVTLYLLRKRSSSNLSQASSPSDQLSNFSFIGRFNADRATVTRKISSRFHLPIQVAAPIRRNFQWLFCPYKTVSSPISSSLSQNSNLLIIFRGREMPFDLMLKPSCGGCGSTTDLYGSNCKHMTLCSSCGKTMAENRTKCYDCGMTLTRLIRVRFKSLLLFQSIPYMRSAQSASRSIISWDWSRLGQEVSYFLHCIPLSIGSSSWWFLGYM